MIDNDMLCEACATKAGLIKEDSAANWYSGIQDESRAGYSAYLFSGRCVVCNCTQRVSPVIEIEYLEVKPDVKDI